MLKEESSNGAQSESTQPLRRRAPRPKVSPRYVHRFVEQLVGDDLHAKRVLCNPSATGVRLRPRPLPRLGARNDVGAEREGRQWPGEALDGG
jgi:hypothetical protein